MRASTTSPCRGTIGGKFLLPHIATMSDVPGLEMTAPSLSSFGTLTARTSSSTMNESKDSNLVTLDRDSLKLSPLTSKLQVPRLLQMYSSCYASKHTLEITMRTLLARCRHTQGRLKKSWTGLKVFATP